MPWSANGASMTGRRVMWLERKGSRRMKLVLTGRGRIDHIRPAAVWSRSSSTDLLPLVVVGCTVAALLVSAIWKEALPELTRGELGPCSEEEEPESPDMHRSP